MWIGRVDLPDELVAAHRSGELVIFVGAGASLDPPSNLPDFVTLVAQVCEDAHVSTVDQAVSPDRILGDLEVDHGIPVRDLVRARLALPASAPNETHRAVADLVAGGPAVRVVTTNYDQHLTAALAEAGHRVTEYHAPALPMGDDFEGVVHLHGALAQDARHLVVTEADFGRAYLRDAWAARFLERMYATYRVLYVGYSHDDVVMNYLGASLGANARRYILTDKPESPTWRRLHVRPVGYPVVDKDHSALPEALIGWAWRASVGALEHRARVADITSRPPSFDPGEMSLVESTILDPERVHLFTAVASRPEWLEWAAAQDWFRPLFDPAAPAVDPIPTLAHWFADRFVVPEDHTELALAVVRDAGGRLGVPLASNIGHALHRADWPKTSAVRKWLMLLMQAEPAVATTWLEMALAAASWTADAVGALLLFEHLSAPQMVFERTLAGGDVARTGVALRGSEHWLTHGWSKILKPHAGQVANRLLPTLERHLMHAHALLRAGRSTGEVFDPWSFGRSAIEPHDQDRYRDPIDAVIDAARDSLEILFDGQDPGAPATIDRWESSGVPLLRRLAVHAWAYRSDVGPDEKLSAVVAHGWLSDAQIHHEVFNVIAAAAPNADASTVAELIDAAKSREFEENAQHPDHVRTHAYELYNLVAWLAAHRPGDELTIAERDAMAETNGFAQREHPDLHTWMETGFGEGEPAMSAAELRQRLDDDAAGAVAAIVAAQAEERGWNRSILSVLEEVVATDAAVGFVVLALEHVPAPIVSAVIRAWSSRQLDDSQARDVVAVLNAPLVDLVADDVAAMLGQFAASEAPKTAWETITGSRDLARRTWAALEPGPAPVDDDWAFRVLNHPAGWVGRFWLRVLTLEWREADASWTGIDGDLAADLERLLAQDDVRGETVRAYFAAELHLFYGADRDWCLANILPLLSWDHPETAARCWDTYLSWGRWNDRLLEDGLLTHALDAASHAGVMKDEKRRLLAERLAGYALLSGLDPLIWIEDFVVRAEADLRVEWIEQLVWLMGNRSEQENDAAWRWIEPYWRGRLDGKPRPLSDAERTAMAHVPLHLGAELVGVAVNLACEQPAGLPQHGFLTELTKQVARAPGDFERLLTHLLRETKSVSWAGHHLPEIVATLRAAGVPVTSVVEQAVRLGFGDAESW